MILTAKKYLEDVLKKIDVPRIFKKLADIEGAMKPSLWAVVEDPDSEEFQPNHTKQVFLDNEGRRTYHVKEYDVSVVLTVRIGATKDEITNRYKQNFLKALARNITDDENYRISVTPLTADLTPEDYELPNDSHVLIRIRFEGGLWRRIDAPLIKTVAPEGEIIKNPKKLEVKEIGENRGNDGSATD